MLADLEKNKKTNKKNKTHSHAHIHAQLAVTCHSLRAAGFRSRLCVAAALSLGIHTYVKRIMPLISMRGKKKKTIGTIFLAGLFHCFA
jgi:hypothetical protein